MDFNWEEGFWSGFAKRAKEALLEDGIASTSDPNVTTHEEVPKAASGTKSDAPGLQKGFEAIASSLSRIGGSLGNAIEESFNMIAPDKNKRTTDAQFRQPETGLNTQAQLKASRDVAMAMAAKVKLLLRELKSVKRSLASMEEKCVQLEEDNKRLREFVEKGSRHDEEDMENANYARENQFLHEVIEYHRMTLQDTASLDDSIEEVAQNLTFAC